MTVPRPMSVYGFAAARGGLVTTADVDSHIHAGLRSAPETKIYARWHAKELRRLQDARDSTVAAYRAAIDAGEIREYSRHERLVAKALSHPDNESTHAARRVLIKQAMRWFKDFTA